MAIHSYVFGAIIALVSYIIYQKYANVYSSIIVKSEKRYDYVIVGAGTTGCVLAARLTEDPKVRVLLVEAGDQMGYFTRVPLTPTAAQQGANDWSVRTVPQRYSSFGLWDQTHIIPRGKGLGGSGQINFLLHAFGLPEDYERWARLGFRGWRYDDLRPYFVKAFGTARSEFDSEHCSLDGYCPGIKAPMKLKLIDGQNELMKTFRQASNLLKDKYTIFRRPTATLVEGARFGSLDAYLKPALNRDNLHVMLKTQAISIRFENTTASSVYILREHRELDNVFVNKEVIVCAGAVKAPQLLMLSGVGPKETTQRLRIRLVADNPHVGRNLHDHMNMPLYVSVQKPVSVTLAKVFAFDTFWNYLWNRQGLLSFPPVAGTEYQNSTAVILFSMGTASERLLRDLSNYRPKVFRDTFPFHNQTSKEGFMFLATCLQPRSRGRITLDDSSISIPPRVDPMFLRHEWDAKCMVRAVRRAEQLVCSQPFQDLGARMHWPRAERCLAFWNYTLEDQTGMTQRRKKRLKPDGITRPNKDANHKSMHLLKKNSHLKNTCSDLKSPPDEYIECVIREVAVTGHHVGGTCAGGTVVDDQLRVKSVSGVRVVDASVLPAPLSLYPNSVLIAMAEKAADIIKSTNKVHKHYLELFLLR